jgi:hypothetical protein
MYLLSQGSWVKVFEPKPLVEDMLAEIRAMGERYEEK